MIYSINDICFSADLLFCVFLQGLLFSMTVTTHAALLRPPMEMLRISFHFKTKQNKTDVTFSVLSILNERYISNYYTLQLTQFMWILVAGYNLKTQIIMVMKGVMTSTFQQHFCTYQCFLYLYLKAYYDMVCVFPRVTSISKTHH